ncbi:MAG: hypothetical protein LBE10_06520 [Treponema sp.]|jgi:hypothetical protein|nr:hypothetical protein [Treponema sp.]
MLEKEFQMIESQIHRFLSTFLGELDLNIIDLDDKDTNGLIRVFTDRFDEIKNIMNWRDKNLLSRAYLLKFARNKYYHKNNAVKITIVDELSDLTNIIVFLNFLKDAFTENSSFNDFLKYLNDLLNTVISQNKSNEKIDTQEDKLDKVLDKMNLLVRNLDDIRNAINNENVSTSSIEEEEKKLEPIVKEIIEKEEESAPKKIKRYRLKREKQLVSNKMQVFSSENLDSMENEERSVLIENKEDESLSDHEKMKDSLERIRKIQEKLVNNNLIRTDIDQVELNKQLQWFNSVGEKKFKSLAGFAASKKLLYPNARQMLYKMGMYISKGWEPSIAQINYVKKLYYEIIDEYDKASTNLNLVTNFV